jgi:hypothetical protein
MARGPRHPKRAGGAATIRAMRFVALFDDVPGHPMSRRATHALAWLLLAGAAGAAPAPAPVRAEIDALLARLEASGCEFNRNDAWHPAAQARAHLLRKLEAVEKRTTIDSAERFIELAGTSSSASGRAYQVRCAGAAAVPSAQWLRRELESLRKKNPS